MRTTVMLPYQALFFKDHPILNWAANNASKHPPQKAPKNAELGLWTLHANPAWSAQHVDSDPTAVAQQLINDFIACFPESNSSNQSIQNPPEAVHTHRWLYARPADDLSTTTENAAPFIYQQQQQIGLAGDWLAGGRVEGAWVSGNALAKQLLA
jgi:predicted NAD/FAD-dependent oxidoreductase